MSNDDIDFNELFDDEDSNYYDGDAVDPFDLEDPVQLALIGIANDYNITNIADIVFVVTDLNKEQTEQIRAQRFATADEAAAFLYTIGTFAFSEIIDFGEGVYGVTIPRDTP